MATATMASEAPPAAPTVEDLEEEARRKRRRRWETAVHEAAHIIVSKVLAEESGLPVGHIGAFLLPGGGGLAYPARGLSKLDSTIAIAAGPASLPIARRYGPPRGKVAPITETQAPEGISLSAFAGVAHDHEQGISDRELVAVFCTRSHTGPTAWSGMWRKVYAKVREILHDPARKREILVVGRHLYRHGCVLPSEIEGIIAGAIAS
jgi:hypothetical protein